MITYTENEVRYYSQIGLSAWRKYNEWLEEYQKAKENKLIERIIKLQTNDR